MADPAPRAAREIALFAAHPRGGPHPEPGALGTVPPKDCVHSPRALRRGTIRGDASPSTRAPLASAGRPRVWRSAVARRLRQHPQRRKRSSRSEKATDSVVLEELLPSRDELVAGDGVEPFAHELSSLCARRRTLPLRSPRRTGSGRKGRGFIHPARSGCSSSFMRAPPRVMRCCERWSRRSSHGP